MSHSRPELPLHRSLRRLQTAFWRRRFIHWLIRAIWLSLLVPVILLAGYFWLGWPINIYILLAGMLLIGGGGVLGAVRPIGLAKMVQRLDKHLELQARLMTAFEVTRRPAPEMETENNQVVAYLVQEAVQISGKVRAQVRLFNRFFWLEVHTLIGVAALLGALLMLDLIEPRLPNAAPQELPQAWQEPAGQSSAGGAALDPAASFDPATQDQSVTDPQLRSALEIIADALRDQATSRAVSEAIDQGDYHKAAEELRRVADRLTDISRPARQELGGALQQAADEIGASGPEFTVPLEAGSTALANDDIIGGGQALEDLAEVIDSLAETSPQASEGGEREQEEPTSSEQVEPDDRGEAQQQVRQERQEGPPPQAPDESQPPPPSEEERLAAEEEPLELESDFELEDRTLQQAELDAEAGDDLTQNSPFARRPAEPVGELGPDPLSYPWDKREIVRNYFTP